MTSKQPTGGDSPSGGGTTERVLYLVAEESAPREADDAMKLAEMVRVVWDARMFVVLCTAIFALLGVAYALLATQWFRADVQLLPRDSKTGSGLSAQLGQLSGLASLTGINLGSAGKEEQLAVLRSHGFARQFIEQQGLTSVLLEQGGGLGGLLGRAKDQAGPDIRDAMELFEKKVRTISEDKKTGLVTISVSWTNPQDAAAWANAMATQVNLEMRRRALEEAQTNIAYLQSEMGKTDVVALQQAIGRLLESELQKLMLARGNEEYAFRVVDRAEPPKRRAKPQRVVVVIAAFFMGATLSVVAVLLRHALRGRGMAQPVAR